MTLHTDLDTLQAKQQELKDLRMRGSPSDDDLRRMGQLALLIGEYKRSLAKAIRAAPQEEFARDEALCGSLSDLLEEIVAQNDSQPGNRDVFDALLHKASSLPSTSLLHIPTVIGDRGLLIIAATDGSLHFLEGMMRLAASGAILFDPVELVSSACFSQTSRIPCMHVLLSSHWDRIMAVAEEHNTTEDIQAVLTEFFADVATAKRALTTEDRKDRIAVLNALCRLTKPVLSLDTIAASDGQTAFTRAAHEGDVEVMKMLLDTNKAGDVNLVLPDGTTALIRAVFSNVEAAVKLVLSLPGVDVNYKGEDGTAVDLAVGLQRTPGIIAALKATGAIGTGKQPSLARAPSLAHIKPQPPPVAASGAAAGGRGRGGMAVGRGRSGVMAAHTKPRAVAASGAPATAAAAAKPGGGARLAPQVASRRASVAAHEAEKAIIKRYWQVWLKPAMRKIAERNRRAIMRTIVARAGPAVILRAAFSFWTTLAVRRIKLRKLNEIRLRAAQPAALGAGVALPGSLGTSTQTPPAALRSPNAATAAAASPRGGAVAGDAAASEPQILAALKSLRRSMDALRDGYASGAFFAANGSIDEDKKNALVDKEKVLLAKLIKKSCDALVAIGSAPLLAEEENWEILEDLLETLVTEGEGKSPSNPLLVKALLSMPLPWADTLEKHGLVTIAACDGNLSYLSWMLDVPNIRLDVPEVVAGCMYSQDRRIPGVHVLLKHDNVLHFAQHEDELKRLFSEFLADIAAKSRSLPGEDRNQRLDVIRRIVVNPHLRPNPEDEGQDRQTVFSRAAREADLELIKLLQKEKWHPSINRVQTDGTTALMQAVVANNAECVTHLLGFPGIDVNVKSPEDGTALDMAINLERDITIAALLKAAGGVESSAQPRYERIQSMKSFTGKPTAAAGSGIHGAPKVQASSSSAAAAASSPLTSTTTHHISGIPGTSSSASLTGGPPTGKKVVSSHNNGSGAGSGPGSNNGSHELPGMSSNPDSSRSAGSVPATAKHTTATPPTTTSSIPTLPSIKPRSKSEPMPKAKPIPVRKK